MLISRKKRIWNDWYDIPISDNEYELLSDEEMDDYFKKMEETE